MKIILVHCKATSADEKNTSADTTTTATTTATTDTTTSATTETITTARITDMMTRDRCHENFQMGYLALNTEEDIKNDLELKREETRFDSDDEGKLRCPLLDSDCDSDLSDGSSNKSSPHLLPLEIGNESILRRPENRQHAKVKRLNWKFKIKDAEEPHEVPRGWKILKRLHQKIHHNAVDAVNDDELTPSLIPPFPQDEKSDEHEQPTPPMQRRGRVDSFLPDSRNSILDFSEKDVPAYFCCWKCRVKLPHSMKWLAFPQTIDPQGKLNLTWLFIVMVAFLYNAVVIPLRFAFGDLVQRDDNVIYWLIVDYVCDLIYVIDITVFEVRMSFVENGTVQSNPRQTRKNYFNKLRFKFDLICLIPTDLAYLLVRKVDPIYRLNRLCKISAFWEFYARCDQAAKSGHVIRILQTISYMLYLIHVEACGYYYASAYENFSTQWTYNPATSNQVTAYVRCFYVATKTATSIGKNPIPTNNLEYLFMTVYWLSGVFVFALLIGQTRDIFEAAGLVKTSYRKTMDITLWYMQSLNLPKSLQNRVRMWFNYNWDQQKTLDENLLIESLPRKMKTDLAIHVHFNTLSKVQLFQDCDKNLLYDLILKLQPVLYLPGDYICMKGEVGTEMYIVMSGQVQVVGGPNNDIVFATLHEGSVFGEISLLALDGGNRRTADVRSRGFSNLFTLSKADFEEAMGDYPNAHDLLKRRANKLLSINRKHEQRTLAKKAAQDAARRREESIKRAKLEGKESHSSLRRVLSSWKRHGHHNNLNHHRPHRSKSTRVGPDDQPHESHEMLGRVGLEVHPSKLFSDTEDEGGRSSPDSGDGLLSAAPHIHRHNRSRSHRETVDRPKINAMTMKSAKDSYNRQVAGVTQSNIW